MTSYYPIKGWGAGCSFDMGRNCSRWGNDTARGSEVGEITVCWWNWKKSNRENSYEMVPMVRAAHRPGYKGPWQPRCLGLVLREGNYFSNFTGRMETRLLQLGCRSGLVVKFAKLERRWNYLKSWSPLLFPHWLLRDRNFRPKRNRPIVCRAVRLLEFFPHFIFDSTVGEGNDLCWRGRMGPVWSIWKPPCIIMQNTR